MYIAQNIYKYVKILYECKKPQYAFFIKQEWFFFIFKMSFQWKYQPAVADNSLKKREALI